MSTQHSPLPPFTNAMTFQNRHNAAFRFRHEVACQTDMNLTTVSYRPESVILWGRHPGDEKYEQPALIDVAVSFARFLESGYTSQQTLCS